MNAVHGRCRKEGALVKRVPVVVGRNDRNVGGTRRLLVDDIDSEADAPANLPQVQVGSASNLPVDSDLDDAAVAAQELTPSQTQVDIHYLFITYSYVFR